MWGGAASRIGFGDNEMNNFIKQNKNNLYDKIPNIYDFLDYKNYYKKMYKIISKYYEDNFCS